MAYFYIFVYSVAETIFNRMIIVESSVYGTLNLSLTSVINIARFEWCAVFGWHRLSSSVIMFVVKIYCYIMYMNLRALSGEVGGRKCNF